MKRKRKMVSMHGNRFNKGLKFEKDERLERRLKKKCAMKKTLKNHVRKREVAVDPDYALFFNVRGGREYDCVDYDEDEDDHNDHDHDPDYVLCLKHLREYGNSYALEISDGMPMFVNYEEDDEFNDDLNRKSLKCFKDVPTGDKVETKRFFKYIRRDKKKESPKTMRTVPSKGRKISMTETNVKAECQANCTARQKPRLKVRYSSMPETKQNMGSVMEDGGYINFLNYLKLDRGTLVLMTEGGKQIRYEDDDENASDSASDIVVTKNVPHCYEGMHSPFVPSKIYYLESASRTSSKFREKLMDTLRKPFDKKEYGELLQEASDRKPLERHRELRSRVTKRCPILESLSKSYLDHYADLKNEIDSARRSHYIVLNLLRGFFYWLKNLSQEGAFRPWLDKAYLKLIRRNAALSSG